jgi:hypothetical protein
MRKWTLARDRDRCDAMARCDQSQEHLLFPRALTSPIKLASSCCRRSKIQSFPFPHVMGDKQRPPASPLPLQKAFLNRFRPLFFESEPACCAVHTHPRSRWLEQLALMTKLQLIVSEPDARNRHRNMLRSRGLPTGLNICAGWADPAGTCTDDTSEVQ